MRNYVIFPRGFRNLMKRKLEFLHNYALNKALQKFPGRRCLLEFLARKRLRLWQSWGCSYPSPQLWICQSGLSTFAVFSEERLLPLFILLFHSFERQAWFLKNWRRAEMIKRSNFRVNFSDFYVYRN
jgi:hypothetical protein